MGMSRLYMYFQLINCYSDESEAMAIDDIPDDILDQEDVEIRPLLPQPIMPDGPPPPTQQSADSSNVEARSRMSQLIAQFLPSEPMPKLPMSDVHSSLPTAQPPMPIPLPPSSAAQPPVPAGQHHLAGPCPLGVRQLSRS